jgi:hypothetical protein
MTLYQIVIGVLAAAIALALVVFGSVAAGLATAGAIRGRRHERKDPEDRYEMDLGGWELGQCEEFDRELANAVDRSIAALTAQLAMIVEKQR